MTLGFLGFPRLSFVFIVVPRNSESDVLRRSSYDRSLTVCRESKSVSLVENIIAYMPIKSKTIYECIYVQ